MTDADDYYWRMAGRRRLIMLQQGGSIIGLCTFFLLDSELEVPYFYHRATWNIPRDSETGTVVYLDKLVCYNPFTFETWRQIEAAITAAHPLWVTACWYRPTRRGADRMYTYRRGAHAQQAAS